MICRVPEETLGGDACLVGDMSGHEVGAADSDGGPPRPRESRAAPQFAFRADMTYQGEAA
jgi:hypothetical protein